MAKVNVSVGITAFNEGKNIGPLLESVLGQEEDGFRIGEIIVFDDGSTDETVAELKKISDPKIKLISGGERMGKATRHNQIFNLAKGKIIVLFDADILLKSPRTIVLLIKPFFEDQEVGLTGGNTLPLKGQTFAEKAILASFEAYERFRNRWREGHSVFNSNGPIMAMSGRLAKLMAVPRNTIAEDHFLYFRCLACGFKFRYVREAEAWYQLPTTIEDHLRQTRRFLSGRNLMKQIFGRLAEDEYAVPQRLIYKEFLVQILKSPFYSLAIFFINWFCRLSVGRKAGRIGALWPMSETTKVRIKNV